MKVKHNKKRNTAFIYEALIREATAAILKQDEKRRKQVIQLLRKHFSAGTILHQDLQHYQSLYENQNLDSTTCEKILKEAKLASRLIDPTKLFKAQTALIHDINTELEPSVFNAFVPNYKTLATISQIFSHKTSPRDQVILEGEIINSMSMDKEEIVETPEVDNLVVKTFVEKFNSKYNTSLLAEQKQLLSYYISSFTDNALELKIYLNEEIGRLKAALTEATTDVEISNDQSMLDKTREVVEKLDSYNECVLGDDVLLTILRTQSLVKEIQDNGSNS